MTACSFSAMDLPRFACRPVALKKPNFEEPHAPNYVFKTRLEQPVRVRPRTASVWDPGASRPGSLIGYTKRQESPQRDAPPPRRAELGAFVIAVAGALYSSQQH